MTPFLNQKEALELQLCDRFTYEIAIGRVRTFFSLIAPIPLFINLNSARRLAVFERRNFKVIYEQDFRLRVPLAVVVGAKLFIYFLGF